MMNRNRESQPAAARKLESNSNFDAVRQAELKEIAKRRRVAFGKSRRSDADDPASPDPSEKPDRLAGLAFSGGGLRSAAFCMGITQAFHKTGLWKFFDYLSTVSGGGYIGAHISSAAIKRKRRISKNGADFPLPAEETASDAGSAGQSEDLKKFIYGGRYLMRGWQLANKHLISLLLTNLTLFSGLVASCALIAFLWRCFDLPAFRERVRPVAYAVDMDFLKSDLIAAYYPFFFFLIAWLFAWGFSYFRRGSEASGRIARVLLFWMVASLLIGAALTFSNGTVEIGNLRLNPAEWGAKVWGPVIALVSGSLIPFLRPSRLMQSGLNPKNQFEKFTFRIATTGLLIGVPLVIIGLLGRENISGYHDSPRRDIIPSDGAWKKVYPLVLSEPFQGTDFGGKIRPNHNAQLREIAAPLVATLEVYSENSWYEYDDLATSLEGIIASDTLKEENALGRLDEIDADEIQKLFLSVPGPASATVEATPLGPLWQKKQNALAEAAGMTKAADEARVKAEDAALIMAELDRTTLASRKQQLATMAEEKAEAAALARAEADKAASDVEGVNRAISAAEMKAIESMAPDLAAAEALAGEKAAAATLAIDAAEKAASALENLGAEASGAAKLEAAKLAEESANASAAARQAADEAALALANVKGAISAAEMSAAQTLAVEKSAAEAVAAEKAAAANLAQAEAEQAAQEAGEMNAELLAAEKAEAAALARATAEAAAASKERADKSVLAAKAIPPLSPEDLQKRYLAWLAFHLKYQQERIAEATHALKGERDWARWVKQDRLKRSADALEWLAGFRPSLVNPAAKLHHWNGQLALTSRIFCNALNEFTDPSDGDATLTALESGLFHELAPGASETQTATAAITGEAPTIPIYRKADPKKPLRTIVIREDQAQRFKIFLISLGVFALGLLVDLNFTSMHGYYRRRIASLFIVPEGKKRESPMLSALTTADYGFPYHLVSGSINLPRRRLVDEIRIATSAGIQDEKVEKPTVAPFLFSQQFCGSEATGFARTKSYEELPVGDLSSLDLADAAAISGGAINPGQVQNMLLSFLMFVLNLRLGQWLPNPSKGRPSTRPRLWLILKNRLLKQGHESNYVFISDGGHSENLGLVQLMQRRCRLIVAVDAGHDPDHDFADLAQAIRFARIEEGIRITPLAPGEKNQTEDVVSSLRLKSGRKANEPMPESPEHYSMARIQYPEPDSEDGVLIYVKPSLTGDESADLIQFSKTSPEFPHQSTSDQDFDWSQVESYRQLGYHIGCSLSEELPPIGDHHADLWEPTEAGDADVEKICGWFQDAWLAKFKPEESGAGREDVTELVKEALARELAKLNVPAAPVDPDTPPEPEGRSIKPKSKTKTKSSGSGKVKARTRAKNKPKSKA